MPLSIFDLPLTDGIYTFVANDGTNTHIASNRLHDWCQTAKLETVLVPVDQKLGQSFLQNNVVTLDRCLELGMRNKPLTPIILGKYGTNDAGLPDVILIDGHHRYALAAMMGLSFILSYCLETSQWKPFEIYDAPSTTQERLASTPILKRHY